MTRLQNFMKFLIECLGYLIPDHNLSFTKYYGKRVGKYAFPKIQMLIQVKFLMSAINKDKRPTKLETFTSINELYFDSFNSEAWV